MSKTKTAGKVKADPAEAGGKNPSAPSAIESKGDTFEVTCPSCKAILVIGRESGEVLGHRRLSDEDAQARRVEEAMDRARRSTELAEKKFAKAQEREKNKMDRLNKLFEETMKKKIEEGDTGRPDRPFDLD